MTSINSIPSNQVAFKSFKDLFKPLPLHEQAPTALSKRHSDSVEIAKKPKIKNEIQKPVLVNPTEIDKKLASTIENGESLIKLFLGDGPEDPNALLSSLNDAYGREHLEEISNIFQDFARKSPKELAKRLYIKNEEAFVKNNIHMEMGLIATLLDSFASKKENVESVDDGSKPQEASIDNILRILKPSKKDKT